jgi:hypothetical protein
MRNRLPFLVLVLALVACGGKAAAPAKGSPTPTRSFALADLARLVVRQSDLPSSLIFVAEASGAKTPDQFDEAFGDPENPEEMAKYREQRLEGVHVATYVSQGAVDALGSETELPAGQLIVMSFVFAFPDVDAAKSVLSYEKQSAPEDNEGVEEIAVSGLGDEGWAFSGQFAAKSKVGFGFGWRSGNTFSMLIVEGGAGATTQESAVALAKKTAARAA